jgi:hypothetical protein
MEPEKKSNGALVGLVVIVIILIIGGIYIWQSNKSAPESTPAPVGQNEAVSNQDSASLDALDQDMQKTDTNTGVDVNAVN